MKPILSIQALLAPLALVAPLVLATAAQAQDAKPDPKAPLVVAVVDGNKLTVDFDKAGRKMVLDSFVQKAG